MNHFCLFLQTQCHRHGFYIFCLLVHNWCRIKRARDDDWRRKIDKEDNGGGLHMGALRLFRLLASSCIEQYTFKMNSDVVLFACTSLWCFWFLHKDITNQWRSTLTKEKRMVPVLPVPVGIIIVQIIRNEIFREVLKAAIIVVIRKKLWGVFRVKKVLFMGTFFLFLTAIDNGKVLRLIPRFSPPSQRY